MTRLHKDNRAILDRIAAGWRPLRSQIPDGHLLARRGMLRLDWGLEGTPDENHLVWYMTDAGRRVLGKSSPRKTANRWHRNKQET